MLKKNFFSKKNSEIDFEEIFLDHLLKKKEGEMGLSSRKLEVSLHKFVFWAFWLGVLGVILAFWVICFRMQIVQGKLYANLAMRNKIFFLQTNAQRGIIYDSHFKQLVWNKIDFNLLCNVKDLPKSQSKRLIIFKNIAEVLNINAQTIKDKINAVSANQKTITIYNHLPYKILVALQTSLEKFPGFEIKRHIYRRYANPESLSHILGYLGKVEATDLKEPSHYSINDYIGKEGLEKSYEKILREQKGKIKIERKANGIQVTKKIIESPKPGESLVLWLNQELQIKMTDALKKVLKETGTNRGAAIALNPQNGAILASVSLPAFDDNLFAQGISTKDLQKINQDPNDPQLNRIIAGLYPTGSVIKPFIASAALQEHVITAKTNLYCPLKLCLENIYTQKKECYSDWKFHGWTTVRRAIAESVNPFFYIIGGGYSRPSFADQRLPENFKGLGVKKIKDYLDKFGFSKKTGIDLPGERQGRIPDPLWKEKYFKNPQDKIWRLGDTYNLSIGQGYLLATPLQVAAALQVIANNGILYQPHLVHEIVDAQKNIIKTIFPVIENKNFIDQNYLEITREGMRQAVTSPAGSSHEVLGDLPFTVAAKTGTAQIPGKDLYDNWIAAFAPYNHPKIVVVVVIEKVKGMRIAALSVAKEVLSWYFSKQNTNLK